MTKLSEYRSTVNLEHIKPHQPLIKPAITNITTNVNNMIRNNIRFSMTIHLKNRMVSSSFFPVSFIPENSQQDYYKELPMERYGFVISDYEWYLHTSKLKEVYNKQKRFIGVMNKRQQAQNNFLDILDNAKSNGINVSTVHTHSEMYPVIYYVTPKTEVQETYRETKTTNVKSSMDSDVQHSGRIESENSKTPQNISVDYVVGKVMKTLEDKLRFDRLKKGW